jgi:hypothetical protein
MKVEVTKAGYWDLKRRYEGEILDIDPALFSKNWMKKIGGGDEEERTIPQSRNVKKPKVVTKETNPLEEDVI